MLLNLLLMCIKGKIRHYLHNINWLAVDHMRALDNCSRLSVDFNWRDKDFNQFLKFSMKSDGRLTWLIIYNSHKINLQVVLNVIITLKEKTYFKLNDYTFHPDMSTNFETWKLTFFKPVFSVVHINFLE
ncbi:hypothetical protein CAEBREN_20834 [Caenorhabditis brenneri]|uniref:Uncharacterized protein n=1 Tax=Caenorhabditis brenneri TaxID=135651 RepID=G0P1W1_CAEBE|nr:hypothetical protein CAEBREN_20834 [Caenorhabditis brenneri]